MAEMDRPVRMRNCLWIVGIAVAHTALIEVLDVMATAAYFHGRKITVMFAPTGSDIGVTVSAIEIRMIAVGENDIARWNRQLRPGKPAGGQGSDNDRQHRQGKDCPKTGVHDLPPDDDRNAKFFVTRRKSRVSLW